MDTFEDFARGTSDGPVV